METDRTRPSTMRIIVGIIMIISGIAIGALGFYSMAYLKELSYGKLWIFNFLWGKLLLLLASGMTFILIIGLIVICTLIALAILQGRQRLMEHIIYPFPTVLTNEIVRDMKIERADDEFLIFDLKFLIRKTLIIVGGVPAFALAWAIYADMDDLYGDTYFSPIPGMTIVMFVMFLYGLFPPSRRFVLDRMNGTITFPRHLFFRRCTIPRSEERV